LPRYSKIKGRTRVEILAYVTNINFAKIVMGISDIDIDELIVLNKIAE
jgi:hypothetical protein